MNLESKIEGLLFYKGEDISIKKLSELLSVTVEEVTAALDTLENSLKERGIVLVRKDDAVMIGIAPELSPLIQGMRKDEISKELSKASLETLSIILYKDDVTRSEIDYIRGVNSSFIVRNLLVRGLVEKSLDPSDSRRTLYKPTFDTLAYMGVTRAEEIPNYKEVKAQLEGVIHSNTETNG
jgi:segregation and condensation protein B